MPSAYSKDAVLGGKNYICTFLFSIEMDCEWVGVLSIAYNTVKDNHSISKYFLTSGMKQKLKHTEKMTAVTNALVLPKYRQSVCSCVLEH